MTTWTREDEVRLREMLERKQAVENTLRECVERAVGQWHYYDMVASDVAQHLIENATVIRKVLEPFDPECGGELAK